MAYNSNYRTRFSPTHGALDLGRHGGSNRWCRVDALVPHSLANKIVEHYMKIGGRSMFFVTIDMDITPPGWTQLEANFVSRQDGLELRALFKDLSSDPAFAAARPLEF